MYLVSIALRNVRRNWARSLLAILGMAMAAGIMTSAQSVTSGYFSTGYLDVRRFMAGDIIIMPGAMYLDPDDISRDADLVWSPWRKPYLNDLVDLHPRILSEGYVHPRDGGFEPIEILDLPRALLDHPEVVAVNPYLSLPAFVPPGHYAPLRGRDLTEDLEAWDWESIMVRGRYFQPADEGNMVAVLNAAETGTAAIPRRYSLPAVGEQLEIIVPALSGFSQGLPVFDYLNTYRFNLTVIGHFQLEVGAEDEGGGSESMMAPVFWNTASVLIPELSFNHIYGEISGGGEPQYVYQLSARVDQIYHAGKVAAQLRSLLPHLTIRSVPELMDMSMRAHGQAAIPRDLSGLLTIVAYAVAGMLVITNLHLVNVQRRREIAIMKAVGASTTHIIILILSESVAYALTGAVLGFAGVRLVSAVIMLMASVPLVQAGLSTALVGLQVAAVTVVTACIFGLIPAWEAATTPTMEVLRDE